MNKEETKVGASYVYDMWNEQYLWSFLVVGGEWAARRRGADKASARHYVAVLNAQFTARAHRHSLPTFECKLYLPTCSLEE